MKCQTCDRPIVDTIHYCPGCLQPTGVVIHDHDADELIQPASLRVLHDGRERELRLRVGRGVIRDVRP